MAKILGNNNRLFIESTTPGTYNQIAGQGSLTIDRKASNIDISDKNSAPYGLLAPGNFAVTIGCDGVPDLPDTTGLGRADTQFKAQAATKFQIRKAPYAVGDVTFEASMYILDCSIEFPKDDAGKFSLSLGLAAAPTTDTMFA